MSMIVIQHIIMTLKTKWISKKPPWLVDYGTIRYKMVYLRALKC